MAKPHTDSANTARLRRRKGKVEEDGSFRTVKNLVWDPDTGKYRAPIKTSRRKRR